MKWGWKSGWSGKQVRKVLINTEGSALWSTSDTAEQTHPHPTHLTRPGRLTVGQHIQVEKGSVLADPRDCTHDVTAVQSIVNHVHIREVQVAIVGNHCATVLLHQVGEEGASPVVMDVWGHTGTSHHLAPWPYIFPYIYIYTMCIIFLEEHFSCLLIQIPSSGLGYFKFCCIFNVLLDQEIEIIIVIKQTQNNNTNTDLLIY